MGEGKVIAIICTYTLVEPRNKENTGYSILYQEDMKKIRKEKVAVKQVTERIFKIKS